MEITWLGHAAFQIETDDHTVLVDPFLSGNPTAAVDAATVEADAILLTHGHGDHIGDTLAIAERTGALVVAPFELAMYCQKKGANVHPMHIGGSREFDFGWVKLVPAWHGSAVEDGESMVYTGNPCGILFRAGGTTVYNLGDTGLFSDMELYARRHPVDVALVPIGDNFTMGIEDAAYATKLISPDIVVPMHYNTFEVITQEPQGFVDLVKEQAPGTTVKVLSPGASFEV